MREFEYHRTSARTPSRPPSAMRCRRWRAWATAASCRLTTRRALAPGLCARGALLSHLQTLLQPRHQIHHVRALRFLRLGDLDLLSLHLRTDDLHQIRAIVIRVLRWVERLRQIPDQLLGHLQLLRPHARIGWKREIADVDQLV